MPGPTCTYVHTHIHVRVHGRVLVVLISDFCLHTYIHTYNIYNQLYLLLRYDTCVVSECDTNVMHKLCCRWLPIRF